MKFWFSLLLIGLVGVMFFQTQRPQARLADQIVFDFNENIGSYSPEVMRLMSFGYSRATGALLWLRFLQHTPPRKVEKNQVSWIYRDLEAITEIDPDFYPAYSYGGIFLSVITEDKRGAEQILLKGIKRFPDRWRLRAYLGYHYYWELDEKEKAAEQYLAAARLPDAPYLMALLASNHLKKTEGTMSGIAFLQNMLKATTSPEVQAKIEEKIRKLQRGGQREK